MRTKWMTSKNKNGFSQPSRSEKLATKLLPIYCRYWHGDNIKIPIIKTIIRMVLSFSLRDCQRFQYKCSRRSYIKIVHCMVVLKRRRNNSEKQPCFNN